MAQRLRTLSALPGAQFGCPAPVRQLKTIGNPSSRGSKTSSGFSRHLKHTWCTQIDKCRTLTHKIINKPKEGGGNGGLNKKGQKRKISDRENPWGPEGGKGLLGGAEGCLKKAQWQVWGPTKLPWQIKGW